MHSTLSNYTPSTTALETPAPFSNGPPSGDSPSSKGFDKSPEALAAAEVTTTVSPPAPSVVFVNTTVTAFRAHRGGFPWPNVTGFGGLWKSSSSCTSGVTTLTETVNITVSVTASASVTPSTGLSSNTTYSWPHYTGNNTIPFCTSATSSPSATSPPRTDSTTFSSSTTSSSPATTSDAPSSSYFITTTTTTTCDEDDDTPPPASTSTITTTPETILYTLSSVTTTPSPIPTDCVIDPFLEPSTTGTPLTPTSTSTHTPTATVCAWTAPSGSPNPENIHCGVRGRPAGENRFIGRYVENGEGVSVTSKGCWQFCGKSVWGTEHGCSSYEFHEDESGKPRCDLYGGPVAFVMEAVDGGRNETWFDLECGDPANTEWHSKVKAPGSLLGEESD
ncbi:hypothetical protein OQA88_4071 [Cercophora sp. LCS_1]